MASEAHIAVETGLRQSIELILAKLQLLGRSDQLDHVVLLDVAKQVFGFNKMVTSVQIAVVLDG